MKSVIAFSFVNFYASLMAQALFAMGLLLTYQGPAVAQTADSTDSNTSAVVLMYHRLGEDSLPSTNIRINQFESHIAELSSGG
ncbi:MAG: hypothetical protein V1255_07605, partial [Alphaproteobacteria bacterium]|nr:hypothetical protein [Alphaproteobacteria bacterium]